MSPLTLAISYFFHLVGTVIWLGGLAVLSLMVYPETKRLIEQHPQFHDFMNRLRRRFVPWANFSLILLIGTGMLQMTADPNYLGFLDFSNSWSVAMLLKHIVIVGMAACSLAIQYGVAPAIERTSLLLAKGKGDHAEWDRLRRREVRLTWLNNLLGTLVLLFTAWMTAL